MAPTWFGRSATCLGFLVMLALCSCLDASRGAFLDDNESSMLKRHEQWMALHGRKYKDAVEKEKRFNVFKENVKYMEQFNKAGNQPYKLSVNEFADLTNEEFKATRNGYKGLCLEDKLARATSSFKYENVSAVPSTMDWRKKGVVTPVKDQGQCADEYLMDVFTDIISISVHLSITALNSAEEIEKLVGQHVDQLSFCKGIMAEME
ncbi:hypothetical protein Syun_008804 [Stephania yunnanensis]|uniref:Cathepsin propeptide inhibitor domain-containing protein n=1 Tax=Stephania yunnanensis TaxID=152371 RepID=A0AAP0KFZ7_9MAGN